MHTYVYVRIYFEVHVYCMHAYITCGRGGRFVSKGRFTSTFENRYNVVCAQVCNREPRAPHAPGRSRSERCLAVQFVTKRPHTAAPDKPTPYGSQTLKKQLELLDKEVGPGTALYYVHCVW